MVEKKSTAKIIDEVFYKNIYEKYYDDWIRNFALNLDNIWNGNSVRELIPKQNLPNVRPVLFLSNSPGTSS